MDFKEISIFLLLFLATMMSAMAVKMTNFKGYTSSYNKSYQNKSKDDINLEKQKRAVPPVVAEMGVEIAKEAVQHQLEVMKEQAKKAKEFVDKKMEINIEPNKGWNTDNSFVPPGFHIASEMIDEGKKSKGEAGDQPYAYPMGVGGMIMNGCFGTNYQAGDPCYEARWKTTICTNLIDGAAFIGVGFDGRGDYSPESRKMSIVQRDCSGRATYDDFDVPDTMNVHGVYDTSATMKSFYSRSEYLTYLQKQAGVSGSSFGFYAGVKNAWGSSSLSGSQKYMALYSIDIDRYEIYLDEVKPNDLSVNFLHEFMDLPVFYLTPGAAVKFQDFILRWGTHYIKSGKFGGQLQIFKTMDASQVSNKEEFSRVMEAGFESLFTSIHYKSEEKGGSSQKKEAKTSSTSVNVKGGDEKIASVITDFNSPTIKNDLNNWLESIRTFPKAFNFMVAPITDLVKFSLSSMFPDEKRDWGCEAHTADMKKDPVTKESYYEVNVNGTLTRKSCQYKDRQNLADSIKLRRNALKRAVAVYMVEGPISASEITLPAGRPGCQTENYQFQEKAFKPTWDEITKHKATFLVILNMRKELSGTFINGPIKLSPHEEKYVRFYNREWFVGDSSDQLNLATGCNLGNGKVNKICVFGLLLTYNQQSGLLTLAEEDFNISKKTFSSLSKDMIGSLIARVEWPSDHIFQMKKVIGYLPCNVEWSNVLRFDPSNQEGKCLHFAASSKGTVFVIFAAVPNNKNTWYYVQISPSGVGIFKSQKLMVSTVDINAVGLGADILYQSYFVCLNETSKSTVIEYGKSKETTEFGDVYLTMIDIDEPLHVRFYSFGNGEQPLEVVDSHIISRHLTKTNCRGGTVHDNQTNMCVQHCHELCDPSQGCRESSSSKPLATNCNACRYVRNSVTGECLRECPDGWKKLDNNTCINKLPCEEVQCLHGGTCENLKDGKFKCHCAKGFHGRYCESALCPNGWSQLNVYCYLASSTIRTWDQAKAHCEELGGELLKITSAEENEFVLALAKKLAKPMHSVWIGLKWNSRKRDFFWFDQSLPTYKNWGQGEPNGAGRDPCVVLWLEGSQPGKWNDRLCGTNINAIYHAGSVCKRGVASLKKS